LKELISWTKKSSSILKDLNDGLNILLNDNVEGLCHNFTTILSTSINKFSIKVSCKKEIKMANPWYDKECKIGRKSIMDDSNESLKYDEINRFKALIKRVKGTM
jgi:hypothetical protein